MKIKCNLTYLYLDAEWPRACWFFGSFCRYRKALYFWSLGISLYLELFCFLSFITIVLRNLCSGTHRRNRFFVDHVPENCNVLSAALRVYDSLIPLHWLQLTVLNISFHHWENTPFLRNKKCTLSRSLVKSRSPCFSNRYRKCVWVACGATNFEKD